MAVTLAQALRLEVIAEGLDTIAHVTELQRLRCIFGQGHFFHRPMARDDLLDLARSEPKGLLRDWNIAS